MVANRALGGFSDMVRAAACSAVLVVASPSAGFADVRLEFSADGKKVDFEVGNVPRREALKQLFSDSPVEIKWINAAFAEQRIGGKFSGAPATVIRQLLAGTNFIVVHREENDASRVVELIIVGPANGELSSTGVAALAAALKPGAQSKVVPDAIGLGMTPPGSHGAPLTPQVADVDPEARKDAQSVLNNLLQSPERNGDATGVLVPPPKGAIPPRLVLTEGAGTPPLSPPSSGSAKDLPLTSPLSGPPVRWPAHRWP